MNAPRVPGTPALDAELRRELDARLGIDQAEDAALLERVRMRVMLAVRAEADAPCRTVRRDAEGWQQVAPGIERKQLWQSGAAQSCLLRLAPGACIPAHLHALDEECIVLEGTVRIGPDLVLQAGDYHVGRQGSMHPAITTETGVMVYLRGAPDTRG